MAFSLPYFKKNLSGTVAIFDVKSGSVGGALVEFNSRKGPTIRYAHRVSFKVKDTSNLSSEESGMLTTLRAVAEKLCSQGLPKLLEAKGGCLGVDFVAVFIGAPWASVRVVTKNIETNESLVITQKWMGETLRSILESQTAPEGGPACFLEQSIIRVLLNGYPTSEPSGKRANRVDIVALEAHMSEKIALSMKEVLEKAFHKNEVSLRSALLASFTTIRDHFESEDNFILMNVGSDITEIALVREDALSGTSILPRGARTLIESAATEFKTVPEEAGARLRLHAEGKLVESSKKLQGVLASLEKDWQQSLDKSLGELKALRGLPHTLFLLVSPEIAPWFSKLLRSPASSLHTLTREPFRVVELHGEELLKHHNVNAEVMPDAPLSIETLFLSRLEETHR